MAKRFELQRAFSMPSSRGAERVVRELFVPPSAGEVRPWVAGAVVVDFKSYLERGAATRTPRTSP